MNRNPFQLEPPHHTPVPSDLPPMAILTPGTPPKPQLSRGQKMSEKCSILMFRGLMRSRLPQNGAVWLSKLNSARNFTPSRPTRFWSGLGPIWTAARRPPKRENRVPQRVPFTRAPDPPYHPPKEISGFSPGENLDSLPTHTKLSLPPVGKVLRDFKHFLPLLTVLNKTKGQSRFQIP